MFPVFSPEVLDSSKRGDDESIDSPRSAYREAQIFFDVIRGSKIEKGKKKSEKKSRWLAI